MENFDEEDISWLTQVPSLEVGAPNFNVEDEFLYGIMDNETENDGLISLEEGGEVKRVCVLYDNVLAEDISSDEEVERM